MGLKARDPHCTWKLRKEGRKKLENDSHLDLLKTNAWCRLFSNL